MSLSVERGWNRAQEEEYPVLAARREFLQLPLKARGQLGLGGSAKEAGCAGNLENWERVSWQRKGTACGSDCVSKGL